MFNLYPFAKPFIHSLDPEAAHTITIKAMKAGITGKLGRPCTYKRLKTTVLGCDFSNPIGLAAGFDKNAEVVRGALSLGFGFAEAGTVTPLPQAGNDKPRIFRLSKDKAVINRLGFNNKGLDYFTAQLGALKGAKGIIGANVGANKNTEDKTADYALGINRLYGLSDYFTVNISSPNTPGLRALQSKQALTDLIERVMAVRAKKVANGQPYIPILVKIAPDLTDTDIQDIADITLRSNIDGLIVSNTTIERPDTLRAANRSETGGLSGRPLMEPSTEVLKRVYQATAGTKPLIGVGGVASGLDAYRKIKAGASLVQLYSALIFEGPNLVENIKADLNRLLKQDGYDNVADAVGTGSR